MRPYEPVLGLALSTGNGGLVAELCDFELVGECPVLLFWGVVEGMCRTSQVKCVWGDSSGGGVQSLFDAHLLYERRKP